jgi:hypothetical protein
MTTPAKAPQNRAKSLIYQEFLTVRGAAPVFPVAFPFNRQ